MTIKWLMAVATLSLPAIPFAQTLPPLDSALPAQVAMDPRLYELYAGRYSLRPGFIITLARDGTHLFAQATGQGTIELFPSGEHEFFAKTLPVRVSFAVDSQGQVTALTLYQGGREMRAPRVAEKTAASLRVQLGAIDAMASAEYAKHPVGSITIGVVAGKDLTWTKSYGYADMERKAVADQDTIYRIGSVTKMFTTLMLEQLAEAGTVRLSDPVDKYFPEMNAVRRRQPNAPAPTLFQLATHTSGMSREPANAARYLQGPAADWEKTLITALKETSFEAEPGVQFLYSNIGYATLGAALARAAETSYVDYVPKHIFEPLGMAHTWFDKNPAMGPHLSIGYAVNNGVPDPAQPQQELVTGRGYKVPNGAAFTTVGDLAKFASFLMGQGPDVVLKASALLKYQKQTAVAADFQLRSGYGLAGTVSQRSGYTSFGHEGAVAGWEAALEINGDQAVGVIVLANSGGKGSPDVASLAFEMLDLLSK